MNNPRPESTVRPLPVLRDMHGQIIREYDILRVFHFYGRRRGQGGARRTAQAED